MTDLDTAANKALATKFLGLLSQVDVPAILDMMDEDATWWVSGRIKGLSGTYRKD